MRSKWIVLCPFVASVTLTAIGQPAAQTSPEDVADPYEVVPGWPQPLYPDGSFSLSRVGAIFAESPNRVYLFTNGILPSAWLNQKDPEYPNFPRRGPQSLENCAEYGSSPTQSCTPQGEPVPGSRWQHILFVVDVNGKVVETWDQHAEMIWDPHGLNINPYDPERHVWLTDDAKEQIFKFTRNGKLVMTVGDFREGGLKAHAKGLHKGSDSGHLGGPNGIAFLPNGDFWVSDGYANSRVVKFSKDGKFLMEFGTKGTRLGQFNTPHSVEVDSKGNLYVGDRGNFRIQIFDQNGNYLRGIQGVYPNALALSADERYLYVAQGGPNFPSEIRKYTVEGRLLSSWGRPYGMEPGQLWGVHDFSRDSDGNLYFGQSYGGGAWKYRPKKGADPKLLIGAFRKNSFQ